MIKVRYYHATLTVLRYKIKTSYRFFASICSYGYDLAQENPYLAPKFAQQITVEAT